MPWSDVQQVADKYPWAVIDPSVLIGYRTPRTFEELADDNIPLWRQYYFEWMKFNKGSALKSDKFEADMHLLTSSARNRKEKAAAAQKFAAARRDKAKQELKENGPLDEFHLAIREIKNAIEKFAKEDDKEVSAIGVRFAGMTLANGSKGDADDRVLGQGLLLMLNGPTKATYLINIQDAVVRLQTFNELTHNEWRGYSTVEDVLGAVHSNWGLWEGRLREAFGQYEQALDYMMADDKGREYIREHDPNPEHASHYDQIDSGEVRQRLWEMISQYGQSMVAEWATIADCFAAMVKWAIADAAKKMRGDFNVAFKEASAGILAAKTAIGVTTTVLAFFPPFGPAVGAGLDLCMTIAEIAAQEILIWQASHDQDTAVAYLGREFKDVKESEREKLLKDIAEYGMTALELMEKGTDLLSGLTEVGIELSPYITDVAKEAAKASFETMDKVMPGVGGLLTVASLAHDWYTWNDDQHKTLELKEKLTEADVKRLEKILNGGFDEQQSNAIWSGKVGNARLLSWDKEAFRVKIEGVEGTIDRTTFRFSPNDRTAAWKEMLVAAKKNNSATYRGVPLTFDLTKAAGLLGIGSDLVCTVPGTCQDGPCYRSTFDFILKISADGGIKVTGMTKPTFAQAASAAGASSDRLVQWKPDDLTFKVDWANARQTGTGDWYYECTAQGEVTRFPLRKYVGDSVWDLMIKLPFRGTPQITGSSETVVKPVVQADVVRAALKNSDDRLYPKAGRSNVQAYLVDWDSAEFSDFDRERGGFQIKSVGAFAFPSNDWNSLLGIWVEWDFEHKRAKVDKDNMTAVGISSDKTDELEKIFTSAVAAKKSARTTAKRYTRTLENRPAE